jgi:hypothetical protein
MEHVCSALIHGNTSLRVLKIGTLLGRNSANKLAHTLERNTTLQRLDFRGGSMDDHVCARIMQSFKTCKGLRSVDLSGNWSGPETLFALSCVLETNIALLEINIRRPDFRDPFENAGLVRLGTTLLRFPRYDHLNIQGVPISRVANQLGMADKNGIKTWTNTDVWAYIRRTNSDRLLAFTMGQHLRVGAASRVRDLSLDCVNYIMMCFFGMPLDSPGRHQEEYEYVSVLRAVMLDCDYV